MKKVKKVTRLLSLLVFLLAFVYLLLPSPEEIPPLSNSFKSTEPGDTVQIPGVTAYYTDLSRQEVVDFYQKNFSRSRFLGLPLITYRLNHPPEYAKEVIRDTIQSSYFEEIVHPFRESLYINGFEWENDPFTLPNERYQNKLEINGKLYKCKVTIRPFGSSTLVRILIFLATLTTIVWLLSEIKIYGPFRRRR